MGLRPIHMTGFFPHGAFPSPVRPEAHPDDFLPQGSRAPSEFAKGFAMASWRAAFGPLGAKALLRF